MGLFTRCKNNFESKLGRSGGTRVYSHPNSKHLGFSLRFPLISAALLAARASSAVCDSPSLPQRGPGWHPVRSPVVCAVSPS